MDRTQPLLASGSRCSGPVTVDSMDYCSQNPSRRHNPVDSICRKLQTIQWRGDREPNSPFQIPKLSSSSYDSPQGGLRRNLEAILKKRAVRGDNGERARDGVRGGDMPAPSDLTPAPAALPCTPANKTATPGNITYTITSTLGELRGGGVGDSKPWQRYCSTPAAQTKDPSRFTFSREAQFSHLDDEGRSGIPTLSRTRAQAHSIFSCNLNFCSPEAGGEVDCELPYPALVVKRLSLGEGGSTLASESRKETMADVSLICEEDLLDTIFHACDTHRRGKVYVSHIVDYLRHTTSRSSGDSGLEELCNMLDPEHKDVSIDLDTYHAVMKEWIDDCRNNGKECAEDLTQDSVRLRDSISAKRSMLLNMTSGSLEAFGGDATRAELETSELVFCMADLQMNNQKLQEEVRKMKQVMEAMEDTNQKLAEENEELRNHARVTQQLAQKEKLLKEEVEEMKMTLSCTEEGRARASAQSKHMARENQSLIAKISSLQEENFKVTMEMDDLQRRIGKLRDINADLQVQIHSCDTVITEKESMILERSRRIEDLKAVVEEYSAVTELLRADKIKLENQVQLMHPDIAGPGLSLSVAYRLNQTSSGSLQTELALAQSPLEGVEALSTTMSFATPLDMTLDREVLLLLQGPSPEHMALEFRGLLNKMKNDFRVEAGSVLSKVSSLLDDQQWLEASPDPRLLTVQDELDARTADWAQGLDQLAQYTDSLEKELIKMASNMRRSRTEILHLSVRVQEQENQKRQLCEELEELKTPQDSREASCQTPDLEQEPGEDLDWDEEFALQDFLKSEAVERNYKVCDGQTETAAMATGLGKESREGEERWTAADAGGEAEPRETSTPLPGSATAAGSQDSIVIRSQLDVNGQPLQEGAEGLSNAPAQSGDCVGRQEKRPPSDPSHSNNNNAESCENVECLHGDSAHSQSVVPGNTPPRLAETVPPTGTLPAQDETVIPNGSPQPATADHGREEGDSTSGDMSFAKSLSQDCSADRAVAGDSTSPLPVLVEEEEGAQGSALSPTVAVTMAGTDGTPATGPSPLFDGSRPTTAPPDQSGAGVEGALSDTSKSDDAAKRDTFSPRGKHKKENLELSRSLDEDLSESSLGTEKEETSLISDTNDREDINSPSPSDKEIETEFHRLSLGFKCDMFTLEKRLRLEERSRDLAEENVRREISSCQGLLQALIPLCEDDNQSMEIILRLQKNLDILIQSMTRVSSRSEMLGAIHQENRIGKAVEVMIQHVENLRRMYTKEHAELLELRETLMQNERSFGSQTERDDFRGKKQSSQYYKSSTRRVSIAAIPRSGGGNMHFDMTKQDTSEAEAERLTRRSPWNVAGKSAARPPLKRFVSSGSWVEAEELSVMMKGRTPYGDTDSQSEEEPRDEPLAERRKSSLSELGSKLTSFILPLKTPSPASSPTFADPRTDPDPSQSPSSSSRAAAAVARVSRGPWLWLAMMVLLAGLLALLAGLVMQPAVDAAPVGTGDSWITIQQLLWPYTGLRHNGQPPV